MKRKFNKMPIPHGLKFKQNFKLLGRPPRRSHSKSSVTCAPVEKGVHAYARARGHAHTFRALRMDRFVATFAWWSALHMDRH